MATHKDQVNIRMSEAIKKAAMRKAKEENRSLSGYIKHILVQSLNTSKTNQ